MKVVLLAVADVVASANREIWIGHVRGLVSSGRHFPVLLPNIPAYAPLWGPFKLYACYVLYSSKFKRSCRIYHGLERGILSRDLPSLQKSDSQNRVPLNRLALALPQLLSELIAATASLSICTETVIPA